MSDMMLFYLASATICMIAIVVMKVSIDYVKKKGLYTEKDYDVDHTTMAVVLWFGLIPFANTLIAFIVVTVCFTGAVRWVVTKILGEPPKG